MLKQNIKKITVMKNLIFALAVCVAVAAKADYIYWMVDPDVKVTNYQGVENSWANAILSIQENGDIYKTSTYDSSSSSWKMSNGEAKEYAGYDAYAVANLGNASYTDKYFLIELFSDSGSWIGGYSASASSLAQYIFSDNSMSPMPSSAFGQVGATYAVPEPTSGLLFLVGGMLLGLKRRRQKV